MSGKENETLGQESGAEAPVNELDVLKQRAKMMGITFSNNIGADALRERIAARMAGEAEAAPTTAVVVESPEIPTALNTMAEAAVPKAKPKTIRQHLIEENMRLVRLRITNLDPKKKDLPGEIFTVANDFLGTVSKYVPFGEVTDNGYHVPYCIYKMMKARKFLNIRTFRDRKNDNQIRVEQNWAQEFALEVLEPLTPVEIQKLATAQSAAGGLN